MIGGRGSVVRERQIEFRSRGHRGGRWREWVGGREAERRHEVVGVVGGCGGP